MGKRNNKGFTLVELVVSVAILAIITAPLLNAFVIAAKNNASAKTRQTVTNYTESMMEKFKAQSFEALEQEFPKIDTGLIEDNKGNNYYYEDFANEEFVFNVNGETLTGNADSPYRAIVKMKPLSYDAPDMTDIDSETTAIFINEVYRNDEAGLQDLYSQISYLDDSVKSVNFKSTLAPNVLSDNIYKNTVRTVSIYVRHNTGNGEKPFEVSVAVTYECEYNTNQKVSKEYEGVFYNTYKELPDILLFYTMYANGGVSTYNDKIIIDNQISNSITEDYGKKCRVYIANQTAGVLAGKKLIYSTLSTSNIFLRVGGMTPAVTFESNRYQTYNTELFMANEIYDSSGVNEMNSLVGTKKDVKLYDITVDIYLNNELLSSMSSTKNAED